MRQVIISPLNQKEFSSFGVVLNVADAQPRLNFTVPFEESRSEARVNLALIKAPRASLPLMVETMERHPHAAQAFIPIKDTSYPVIVAPSGVDDLPDLDRALAFLVPVGLGVVWHVGMTALSGPGHFAMMISEAGRPDDCIYQSVEPFTVIASECPRGIVIRSN